MFGEVCHVCQNFGTRSDHSDFMLTSLPRSTNHLAFNMIKGCLILDFEVAKIGTSEDIECLAKMIFGNGSELVLFLREQGTYS